MNRIRTILSFYDNGYIKKHLILNNQNYLLLTNGDLFAWSENNDCSKRNIETVNGQRVQNFPSLLGKNVQSIDVNGYSLQIVYNDGYIYSWAQNGLGSSCYAGRRSLIVGE